MYKLIRNSTAIKRLADGANIPQDSGNIDYQEYQKWVAAGGITEPADSPTAAEENAPILQQIKELENSTLRAIREHILGDATALDRLRVVEDRIVQERQKLKPQKAT